MAKRYPAQLSGGQRQRVGVARALAADPPLMLMDEPFGAIDPINRERLQNEFLRLQAEIRKTIVFVTHDIDEAIKMGDRIAILQVGGKLAQYAPPEELLHAPRERVRGGLRRRRPRAQAARRCCACRDIELGASAMVGPAIRSPTCARRARGLLDTATRCVVDADGRPRGWLSERPDRRASRGCARPRADVELDDICATRCDLLAQAPDPRGVDDGRRRRLRALLRRASDGFCPVSWIAGQLVEQRLLPELDRRLTSSTVSSTRADVIARRDRLRDRVLARAASRTGGAG